MPDAEVMMGSSDPGFRQICAVPRRRRNWSRL